MAQITTAILSAFATNHRIHGEQATIRLGGQAVGNVDVIPGKSEAESIDPVTQLVTMVELQDFHVLSSSLVWPNGTKFVPERGMVIEVTRSGQVHRFAVTHPNEGQSPYRRADAYGAVLRVHTIEREHSTPSTDSDDEEG